MKASIIFIVFTSYFAHAKAERNENKIQNIHFVLMGDVSYSMKEAYDNNELHEKSGKIYLQEIKEVFKFLVFYSAQEEEEELQI